MLGGMTTLDPLGGEPAAAQPAVAALAANLKVKLLIVDPQPMLRQGLRQALAQQPKLTLVGETATAAQALSLAQELAPDLIVMDAHLPDLNGIQTARQILAHQPAIKIVIFSSEATRSQVDEALRAGASGYVLKSGEVQELLRAIDLVMAGKLYLSPEASTGILEDYRKNLGPEAGPPRQLLSEREKQLLRQIAAGRRNKEIAIELAISVKSVEAKRSRLMKKLGCASLAELIHYAIRDGMAPL